MVGLNAWIALKNMRHRWKSLVLSGLGISASFIMIFTVFFMSDSVLFTLNEVQLEPIGTVDLSLQSNQSLTVNQSLVTALEQNVTIQEKLDAISPRLTISSVVGVNEKSELVAAGLSLIGVDFQRDEAIGLFEKNQEPIHVSVSPSIRDDASNETILNAVITDVLADALQLHMGDRFKVHVSFNPSEIPLLVSLKVEEIVDSTGKAVMLSHKSVFVNLSDLQAQLNLSRQVTSILLSLNDDGASLVEHERTFLPILEDFLQRNGFHDVEIIRIRDQLQAFIDEGASNTMMTLFFFGLPTLISGLVLILIIIFLLIEERLKELAILKAIGHQSRDIFVQLLIEGVFMGLAGGVFGSVGGWIITQFMLRSWSTKTPEGTDFSFVPGVKIGYQYQFHVTMESFVTALAVGLIVMFIPLVIASWRLAKFSVVDVLYRYQFVFEGKLGRQKNRVVSALFIVIGSIFVLVAAIQLPSDTSSFILAWVIGSLLILLALTRFSNSYSRYLSNAWILVNFLLIAFISFSDLVLTPAYPFKMAIFYMLATIFVIILMAVFLVRGLLSFITTRAEKLMSWNVRLGLPILHAAATIRAFRHKTTMQVLLFSFVFMLLFMSASLEGTLANALEHQMEDYSLGADFIASVSVPLTNHTALRQSLDDVGLLGKLSLTAGFHWTMAPVLFGKSNDLLDEWLHERMMQNRLEIYGLNDSARTSLSLKLHDTVPDMTTEEAWQSFFSGKGVFLSKNFRTYFDVPWMNITIQGSTRNETLPLLGFLKIDHKHVFMSKSLFARLFPDVTGDRLLFFSQQAPNNDVESLRRQESSLVRALLPWAPSSVMATEMVKNSLILTFSLLFDAINNFLFLGLLIGVVGVSLVIARRIQRSRFEISVLVSMGVSKIELITSYFIELMFLIISSVIIGFGIPMVFMLPGVSALMGAEPSLATMKLLTWALVTLLVALLSFMLPLYYSTRCNPSENLRRIET